MRLLPISTLEPKSYERSLPSGRLRLALLASLACSVVACSGASEPGLNSKGGAGGTSSSAARGGSANAGNPSGTTPAGGSAASGGIVGASGGAPAAGGSQMGGGLAAGGSSSASGGMATGGATAAGGSSPTGGSSATGGVAATGGVSLVGGSSATGAASTVIGGSQATGGATAAGGSSLTGGAATTGGNTAAGGSPTTGGLTAAGGTVATGGVTATGGAAAQTEFFIGPTGLDTNPGTETLPWKTFAWATMLAPQGATIWVLPGTYTLTAPVSLSKPGLATSPTKLWARSTRPVLDWTGVAVSDSAQGIIMTADYWHLRGLELANAGDNCILITGSNNTVEDVIVHNCADSGIQITVPTAYAGNNAFGANNTILNCDSYSNADATGENADGFSAKLRIGPGNVFRGCRAWSNSDDGWDFFAANDVVTIENCWAFLNGSGTAGDGNGFKLGGASDGTTDQGGARHVVTNTASFENRAYGYTLNNNTSTPVLTTCKVRSNGSGDCSSLSCSPSTSMTTTGANARTIARNADGSLPAIP